MKKINGCLSNTINGLNMSKVIRDRPLIIWGVMVKIFDGSIFFLHKPLISMFFFFVNLLFQLLSWETSCFKFFSLETLRINFFCDFHHTPPDD